jgi:hypothetical protein
MLATGLLSILLLNLDSTWIEMAILNPPAVLNPVKVFSINTGKQAGLASGPTGPV